MRLPRYHAYVRLLIDGHPSRPFSMRTTRTDLGRIDATRAEIIRRYSRRRYTHPADIVQHGIEQSIRFSKS